MGVRTQAGERGGSPADAAEGADPRRWKALWVTLVAGFMSLLDVTIVAVALPSMQQDLHASAPAIQWVVSGYALAFALVLVTAGRVGDAIGRRRIFLLALTAFVLCSAAAGAAPTITLLVVARLAQGAAAGCLAPQNSALIQQMFREPSAAGRSACSGPPSASPARSAPSSADSCSRWRAGRRDGAGSSTSTYRSA